MEQYQVLEQEFRRWVYGDDPKAPDVVCCGSGTAAIHLALEALQLPLGSEVITSDFNMIAVPRAITLAGLTPVFVDCCSDLLIDELLVDRAVISSGGDYRTKDWDCKALVAVHIYGRRCRMDNLHDLAERFGLNVVEDLAEAHGVRPHPSTDAACWSFFRNKIISCADGEGGAVAFRNPAHAARDRQLRCLGFTEAHDFTHIPRGHNYRLSNVHASLILDSLRQADVNLSKRRQVERWYDDACPAEWRMPARDAVWVYDLRIPGMSQGEQDRLVKTLNAEGIAARHAFKPMSEQEEYKTGVGSRGSQNSNAYRLSREVIYLPVSPAMDESECQWIMLRVFAAMRRW